MNHTQSNAELPIRHRVARGAIIIYFVILLVSGFVMCSCPSFFAAMALCAVVAVIYGSRFQRILSVGMLVIAVTVGVIQFRQDRQRTQRTLEHLRQINEHNKQQRAQMQSVIVPLLINIAQAMSPAAYLKAQDDALPIATEHSDELRSEATNNPEAALRIEALGLVELIGGPDAEAFLLARLKTDADAQVAEHAKSLLFRATVAKNARNSGQMSEAQYQTYRKTSRQLSAEALFKPVAPAPETRRNNEPNSK